MKKRHTLPEWDGDQFEIIVLDGNGYKWFNNFPDSPIGPITTHSTRITSDIANRITVALEESLRKWKSIALGIPAQSEVIKFPE